MITKQQLDDAASCANFMQKFKMLLWEAARENTKPGPNGEMWCLLPTEKALDEIAMELYDYLKH